MIQKKSLISSIKRALQTGTFNYVGQDATSFPSQIYKIDSLKLDDQNWWECNPISKVDVSNNQITQIPDGIVELADLQVLRVKNNKVKELPQILVSFANLKSLDLSRNCLTRVPEAISQMSALVEFNLSENMIEYCPNLDKIQTLELLYLNNNKLKAIPDLGQGLKKAQLQQNKIQKISRSNFWKCTNLETLIVNKNIIESIEEGSFNNSKNLIILQLKQNRLAKINELPNSQKLDTISLSFNRLVDFNYFDRCPNLTVLVLSDNKIKTLSKDIIKLNKLKTLDLSNNDLSDLPCEIGFINSLVRIQLEGNPLKTMRQNVRTGGTNVVKKYLQDRMDPKERENIQKKVSTSFEKVSEGEFWGKILYQFTQSGELILRKMNLTHLDELVFEKNLKGLNVSENKITQISESIYKLDQLKYIIVNNNELKSLPNSLERLPILEQIEAKNNLLTDFVLTTPFAFPKLHFLDLSANKIKSIPKGILKLPRLRTLHLAYNNLTSIQEIVGDYKLLPFLEVLDVSNNRIEDVSDGIYFRVSLNYLNLQNNNLGKIPTLLGFMKLSGLKIDGNPLKLIKRTVIDKGTVAILEFLKTRHTGPLPQIPDNIVPVERQQFVIKPQKTTCPYQTQPKFIKNPDNRPQEANSAQKEIERMNKIEELQIQIKSLQYELDNSTTISTTLKSQKRRQMQGLMVERNKLIKGQ